MSVEYERSFVTFYTDTRAVSSLDTTNTKGLSSVPRTVCRKHGSLSHSFNPVERMTARTST